jgi:hypothetical protein
MAQRARAVVAQHEGAADSEPFAGACAYAAVPSVIKAGNDYVIFGEVGESIVDDDDSAPVCWHHVVQVRPHRCAWRRTVTVAVTHVAWRGCARRVRCRSC